MKKSKLMVFAIAMGVILVIFPYTLQPAYADACHFEVFPCRCNIFECEDPYGQCEEDGGECTNVTFGTPPMQFVSCECV